MNTYTTPCGVNLIATTIEGVTYTFPTTECCGASATGSGDEIVCKACFEPVPDVYGGAMAVTGTDTPTNTLPLIMAYAGCPIPEDCAAEALYQIGATL